MSDRAAAGGTEAGEDRDALDRALELAYRQLAQRDRSEAELRRRLESKGIAEGVVERAITALAEQGHVDDGRFAHRFAADRRTLDHWGAERIERRLLELGIDGELVAAALAEQSPAEELGAAIGLLQRRFPAPPAGDRDRNRALGLLVRRGYGLDLSHEAIRAYARDVAADR